MILKNGNNEDNVNILKSLICMFITGYAFSIWWPIGIIAFYYSVIFVLED